MSPQPATIDATRSQEPLHLLAHAREHRYRIRNLHDGGPVPPARCKKTQEASSPQPAGYIGPDDRCDAIVGHRGYVVLDGSRLSVCLFFKSSAGVTYGAKQAEAAGVTIDQVGDTEIGGSADVVQLDNVLKLIRVSKLRPGRPDFGQRALVQTGNSRQEASQMGSKGLLQGAKQN